MIIDALDIATFRNLRAVHMEPHPRFNVVAGANGQGKTNLVEAINLLATLRSFRALRNRDLLLHGEDSAVVEARVRRGEARRDVRLTVRPTSKRVELNGNALRQLDLFFGQINAVNFSPEDVTVFRGGPAERRLFFDRMLFNLAPAYARQMSDYEDALRQRNALLKEERLQPALIEAFDGPLARAGAAVVARRLALLRELEQPFAQAFGDIFDAALPVRIDYECSFAGDAAALDEPALHDALAAALREQLHRDHARGYTTVGPHRDDLVGVLQDQPLRTWGSQGQHRAFVLALKTTEIQLLERSLGFSPILLLDDVSSELDPLRNARLFDFLGRFDGQVFITTTDASFIRLSGPCRQWRVHEGDIREAD